MKMSEVNVNYAHIRRIDRVLYITGVVIEKYPDSVNNIHIDK